LLVTLDYQGPKVLLEFSLIYTVFILYVLERYLGFFLELSQLVLVVEDQMLYSLLVDLNFNFVLLP
jgi:hypothetical protein